MKKEHPDWKVTEISKHIGELWGQLNDSEKQPYIDRAEQDRQRYQREVSGLKAAAKEEASDEETI